MRWPLRCTSPLLGAMRPLMRLNRVDLPAPLGPMMATRSPAGTARFTPRMISVLPKLLRRSLSSSAYVMCCCSSLRSKAVAALDFRLDLFLRLAPQDDELAPEHLEDAAAHHQQHRRDGPGHGLG